MPKYAQNRAFLAHFGLFFALFRVFSRFFSYFSLFLFYFVNFLLFGQKIVFLVHFSAKMHRLCPNLANLAHKFKNNVQVLL